MLAKVDKNRTITKYSYIENRETGKICSMMILQLIAGMITA